MHSNDGRLRVGLLGYGFAGKIFHAPLISAEPSLQLVAVSSSDRERVHADLPEVEVSADARSIATSDLVDLVVVATPNDSHAPLARAALEAGKSVVVDKPFAVDLVEAGELVSLAERHDRTLTVFHNRRWDSDFLTVRRAIDNQVVGNVTHFESRIDRYRPDVRDRWRERPGPGSGLWFDLGPHLIDQAMQLFGPPDTVIASMACQRSGSQTDDWAHVILEFGQRRAVLHASLMAAGGTPRFMVHGERGSLVKQKADQQEAQILAGLRPGDADWGRDDDPLKVFDADGSESSIDATPGDQRNFYSGLAQALIRGMPAPVSPLHALTVMAVLEAAATSARTKTAVSLALNEKERASWTLNY
jgi:predicted dehydrogenase